MSNLKYFELFCIKYEYFKRNSAQQAHRNLNNALDEAVENGLGDKLNDVTRFPYSDDYGDSSFGKSSSSARTESYESDLTESGSASQKTSSRSKFESDSSEGPSAAKKAEGADSEFKGAKPGPSDVGIPLREASSPDIDSDNSNVSTEEDQQKPSERRTEQYIRWYYRKAADLELATTEYEYQDKWSPERILTLLSIRRISSTRTISLLVDSIFITVGYRKIAIKMRENNGNTWFETKYMSTENGCFVWYGDTVRYDKKYKYQSLAAKDYIYVVKNNNVSMFEELKFDIEKYTPRSVPVWPFKSFFGKLRNFFAKSGTLLSTNKFSMTVFKPHGEAEAAKAIETNTVYPVIGSCSAFCFHIWDDREVCAQRGINYEELSKLPDGLVNTDFFHLELSSVEFGPIDYEWDSIDFSDLRCYSFNRFKMSLSQNEFKELLLSVSKLSSNPSDPNHSFTFEVNSKFDLDEAKREIGRNLNFKSNSSIMHNGYQVECGNPGGKKEINFKWVGIPTPEENDYYEDQ